VKDNTNPVDYEVTLTGGTGTTEHSWSYRYAYATDGSVSSNYVGTAAWSPGSYFEATFSDGVEIVSKVKFWNRYDCCGDRMRNAIIEISGQTCGTVPSTTTYRDEHTITCSPPLSGSKVRITVTESSPIGFGEIKVYS